MRSRDSIFPFVLLVIWVLLAMAFLLLRPRPHDALFWILLVPALITGGGYMFLSKIASRRVEEDVTDWYDRLSALVDVRDFEDDGHLYEQFDPDEREHLLRELEQMPVGSRSLRKAIAAVAPELADENA